MYSQLPCGIEGDFLPNTKPGQDPLLLSFLILRRVLGILGTTLPFILWFGGVLLFGEALQSSVSQYYHTMMRDVFVAILCAIGVFLITYKGYEKEADEWVSDNAASNIAGFAAILVALFPTTDAASATAKCLADSNLIGMVHLAAAVVFFGAIACISYFKFTRSVSDTLTAQKIARNRIYRICGLTIVAAIVAIAVHSFWSDLCLALVDLRPVFFLEAIAVIAFGVAWLTKGEVIYGDPDNQAD